MNNLVKKLVTRPGWAMQKAYLYSRSYLTMSKDDVVLALFPKTGSTWVRFFLYNVLTLSEGDGHEVSIDEMNQTMPEFGHPSMFRKWPFKTCPRVIKSHRACNPILAKRPTVVVVRDPRDVMVSFHHYVVAKKEIGYSGTIKDVIHDPEMGLENFFAQYESWKGQADLILRYEDLKAEPVREFTRLVEYLKIPATPEQITLAVERSDMSHMRKAQEESKDFKAKFSQGFVFARSGASKQWEGLFDEDDIAYWETLKKQHGFTLYD